MKDKAFAITWAVVIIVGATAMALWPENAVKDKKSDPRPAVVMPELTPEQQQGELAYSQNCIQCHGVNGIGTDQGPSFLNRVYHPGHHADGAFYLAVRNGTRAHHWPFGDMPPQPQVQDGEVTQIIAFVRAVQRANGFAPK